jgi:uncharacterized protein YhhL (DUF1145 family)
MEKGAKVKGGGTAMKVAVFLAVLHPLEAVVASRMAARRGRDPRRWALATLLFGVFALLRLRGIPPKEG